MTVRHHCGLEPCPHIDGWTYSDRLTVPTLYGLKARSIEFNDHGPTRVTLVDGTVHESSDQGRTWRAA